MTTPNDLRRRVADKQKASLDRPWKQTAESGQERDDPTDPPLDGKATAPALSVGGRGQERSTRPKPAAAAAGDKRRSRFGLAMPEALEAQLHEVAAQFGAAHWQQMRNERIPQGANSVVVALLELYLPTVASLDPETLIAAMPRRADNDR